MSFSAADAAFEGFRLARRAPIAIAIWALLSFLSSLVSGVILVGLAGAAGGELIALSLQGFGTPDPAQLAELMARTAPAMLALAVWSVLFNAVLLSAVARAVLRPQAAPFGYVRLGRVEAVQVVNLLLWTAAALAAYLAVAVVSGVLTIAAGAVAGPAGAGATAFLALAAALVLVAWVAARLSLAGPATVDTGRVGVSRSWALSAGSTRPLVGATLLAVSLAIVVMLLVSLVFAPLTAALGGGGAPDTSSLAAMFTPGWLVSAAASGLASALAMAILGGYGARAYQLLGGERADDATAA